jgi:hypothetical protein
MAKSKSPKDTKGPVVKSGPTKGQNRSRTKDGTWRSKRSDAGKSRSKSSDSGGKKGCFLTSAACQFQGLPDDCHELQVLRTFRDEMLSTTPAGLAMVEDYYRIAPPLVPLLNDQEVALRIWNKIKLTVLQVEANEHEEAVETYKDMVRSLQKLAAN